MPQISKRDGVPGHYNIESNCIANELARQGTSTDILRNKDTVGMRIVTCKLLIKQRLCRVKAATKKNYITFFLFNESG